MLVAQSQHLGVPRGYWELGHGPPQGGDSWTALRGGGRGESPQRLQSLLRCLWGREASHCVCGRASSPLSRAPAGPHGAAGSGRGSRPPSQCPEPSSAGPGPLQAAGRSLAPRTGQTGYGTQQTSTACSSGPAPCGQPGRPAGWPRPWTPSPPCRGGHN